VSQTPIQNLKRNTYSIAKTIFSIEFCFVTFIKTLEVCDISRKIMLTTKEREYSLNALLYPSN